MTNATDHNTAMDNVRPAVSAQNPPSATITARRLRERAAKAQAEADRANAVAHAINERFEGGQPIILNHASTAGARRDREMSDNQIRKAIAADKRADELGRRADRAESIADVTSRLASISIQPGDVEVGDIVYEGNKLTGATYPYVVARVNAKSVSVVVPAGWDPMTIKYERLVSVTKKQG